MSPAAIIVSNRGPVEFGHVSPQSPEFRLGSGGLVTGLLAGIQHNPTLWISLTMTEADRHVAREPSPRWIDTGVSPEGLAVRMVEVSDLAYSRHYHDVGNRLLWPLHHYLLDVSQSDTGWDERLLDSWDNGYVVVNRRLADAVDGALRFYGADTPILFQDYHTYLAPLFVRSAHPQARLAHSSCVPWPEPRYWERCPDRLVQAIFQGMVANDVLVFQTSRDASNFVDGVATILSGASVKWHKSRHSGDIAIQGRQVRVLVRPLSLSQEFLRDEVGESDVDAMWAAIRSRLPSNKTHRIILRVDRIEPTKNILRGFEAFARLLRDHEPVRGQVTFLCLLVPSRQDMEEYRAYDQDVRCAIASINAEYGEPGWQPVVALYGHDRARALACLRNYDVLLINPVIDGLNLVAKEGGLLNERNGCMVLSRTAGVHDLMRDHVASISPFDVGATADAIYAALCMPESERKQHALALRELLVAESDQTWLTDILGEMPPVPTSGEVRR